MQDAAILKDTVVPSIFAIAERGALGANFILARDQGGIATLRGGRYEGLHD